MRGLAVIAALLLLPGHAPAQNAAARGMVITSDRAATEAGLAILRKGGSAADAAVAAALVLTVTAPFAASPGGVGYALSYRTQSRDVTGWDGSAIAPAAVGPGLFTERDGKPMTLDAIRPGGRAVGVPGVMPMLQALQHAEGSLSWAQVAEPAIELADKGFAVSPALARAMAETGNGAVPDNRLDLRLAAVPKVQPQRLRNPPLADALRAVAKSGADAILRGPIAGDIATLVRNDPSPGLLTADDLAAFPPPEHKPLCTQYHGMQVCAPPSPSQGGVALIRSLGVLENTVLPKLDPAGAQASALLLRAWQFGRREVARNLADSEFAPDALAAINAPARLAADGKLLDQSPPKATPMQMEKSAPMLAPQDSGVTVLVVDQAGNAVSLSLSLHSRFGARLQTHGFALNDSLAGFTAQPDSNGVPLANRVEGGKRPLAAMTPVIVLDPRGRLRFILGAEDGEDGAALEAQMLLRAIDFRQSPSAVAAAPSWHWRDGVLELEDGVGARLVLDQLRQSGTAPRLVPRSSHAALIAWFDTGPEGVPSLPAEMGVGRQ